MSSKLDPICPSIDFCPTRYSGSALRSEGFVQDKSHTRVAKSPLALVTLHLGQKGQKPIKNSSVFGFRPFVLLSTRAQELTINPPLSPFVLMSMPPRVTPAPARTRVYTRRPWTKGQKDKSHFHSYVTSTRRCRCASVIVAATIPQTRHRRCKKSLFQPMESEVAVSADSIRRLSFTRPTRSQNSPSFFMIVGADDSRRGSTGATCDQHHVDGSDLSPFRSELIRAQQLNRRLQPGAATQRHECDAAGIPLCIIGDRRVIGTWWPKGVEDTRGNSSNGGCSLFRLSEVFWRTLCLNQVRLSLASHKLGINTLSQLRGVSNVFSGTLFGSSS